MAALPPTSLVNAERVTVGFGLDPVLEEVSLGISGGDRIGIVGRNGGGKSTLIAILAGLRAPDSGRVSRTGGVSVGVVRQDDELDEGGTVRDNVLGGVAEHDWAGDPAARDVVTGLLGPLGGGAVELDTSIAAMSGGERRRIALARELVRAPDVLFLDEPTNHLDVEGVAWLADHLVSGYARADRALAVITHDRWFLDAVATRTWEVVDGGVTPFDGGYAAYVLAKAERERMAGVVADRRSNLLRKELAWLRRGPPARTSKPKFRIDAANALIATEPPPRNDVELLGFATARLGKDVVDLHDASVVVPGQDGGHRTLLDRVTWQLAPGERVGIVGVNGAGKSTLLRVIAGEQPLTSGRRKQGVTVAIGHLTQDVSELERFARWRVIEAVEDVRSYVRLGSKELSAAQVAQRLGFTGPAQQTRVADLSGGERRRLQLTRILMAEPNVLLLDEPTNDLDIETLTSLEDVLDGWAGTLLVVSHDRYLLERVCDRQVALLGDGRVRDLPGGVEEYLRLRRAAVATADQATLTGGSVGAASPTAGTVSPAEQREARKTMARVERQLARLAEREAKVHDAMAAAATDHARVLELNRDLREIVDDREALELEWLEAAEVIEE
ncbi:ATP-binding cassette domain-containing protein [Nostocoides sp. F2B08]|uniref:ABC-F family ATP-binding cassette domain-containing protein n=1 Tax=Nostocoides sp. F2B08 TaxID=2653936 RepID=UPI001263A2FD|nr:ABC-F family ATP-binding cassette domain-containing protein [Tetrasphaera sp. F2B08]KAB7743500.1 ATP-binding cassette domain-containing protein [Tetrasphaera sp. F2B08]